MDAGIVAPATPEPAPAGGGAADEAVVAEPVGAAALENGANVWPDETAEVAFFAEQREQGAPVAATRAVEAVQELETKGTLPALDELVQRIPAAARELMDELFRAKFIAVKRVPKAALKE
ncbi:MAG: hypothetical protein WCL24_13205 [Verrucomicrobiota bacterium]